jgi:hypothetical protein
MSEATPSLHACNQLEHAASSYLRSAMHQPVQWHAWGEAAFARAQAENKPMLLDIGAVWCHWCHVMDRESYEDAEIAALISQHFIAVKVDRDERPDVDARYQAAVSAISGQGGWPLTAFLTPDGRPYFGGTYFPRQERYGRPGFSHILLTMARVWQERRDEAIETASSVMAAIEQNESFSGRGSDGSSAVVEKIAASALKSFDPRHGGFGSQPKFPHAAVLDLLLHLGVNRGNAQALEAFTVTLDEMARGGVYDQLAGGFHRYSVDEHWGVPHFEKMLYDNTELLRNYAHGYQSPIGGVVREDFRVTAQEIVAWLDGEMSDRERGGFYASQDADVGLDDDGDYFTWTLEEARSALAPDEFEFARRYWDIRELGDMHHNPAKNVLHAHRTPAEVAAQSGEDAATLDTLFKAARSKLLAARALRPTPFIDRTLYTGWNAMAVTAYLEAARALRMDEPRAFALKTLDRLLAAAWDGAAALRHVIAYPDGVAPAEQAPGTLDDYAFTVHACLDGWVAAGEMRYYRTATQLADAMIARFYDRAAGAFYDSAPPADGVAPLGALSARRKPLQDSPTPAGNPTAAAALVRLEALSGNAQYREAAEDTLDCFAGIVEHFGLYAGSYGLALERLLADPVQVVIVGSGADAEELETAAMAGYAVNKSVMRIDAARLAPGGVPEALAETVLQVPALAGQAWALVCKGRTCLPPLTDADALRKALSPAG